MDRKLIHYLPPYMQEYKEIQAAQEAVEPEVGNIWSLSKDMLREAFIASESEYGAMRWEGILGLRPKDTDSLEVRNIRILAKINETLPYTMTKLKRFLDSSIGQEFYEIKLDAAGYQLQLWVQMSQLKKIREVMDYMERVVPVNLILWYIGKQEEQCPVPIRYQERLGIKDAFYPRYNIPFLMYDGTARYNGRYKYNGYKTDAMIDLYPLRLAARTAYRPDPYLVPIISMNGTAGELVSGGDTVFNCTAEGKAEHGMQYGIKMEQEARLMPKYAIHLTIGKHLTRYDGTYRYDGARRYDSEIIHEVI